jgi:hypothetical protein
MHSTETNTPIGAQGKIETWHGLRASGKRQLVRGAAGTLLQPLMLFAAAGRLDLTRFLFLKGIANESFPCNGSRANAAVTICHSRTKDLAAVTRGADILIVAIGVAKFISADMVQSGATVVDVGMNRTKVGLVGDVDFEDVREVAGRITPVPGGVGPLTISMLSRNTLTAAQIQVQ